MALQRAAILSLKKVGVQAGLSSSSETTALISRRKKRKRRTSPTSPTETTFPAQHFDVVQAASLIDLRVQIIACSKLEQVCRLTTVGQLVVHAAKDLIFLVDLDETLMELHAPPDI